MSYPLTLVEFKSWLESKNEKEVIGIAREGLTCPIATALRDYKFKENQNVDDIEVGQDTTVVYYSYYNGGLKQDTLANPAWVCNFIDVIDEVDEDETEVTAKDALEIVNNFSWCTVCEQDRPEGTNCGKKDNCPW